MDLTHVHSNSIGTWRLLQYYVKTDIMLGVPMCWYKKKVESLIYVNHVVYLSYLKNSILLSHPRPHCSKAFDHIGETKSV